jgi:phosphatidylglycerophosphate synthase
MRHAVVLADSPSAWDRLCGITLLERLLRTLERSDVREAVMLSFDPESTAGRLASTGRFRPRLAVRIGRLPPGPVATESLLEAWDEAGYGPEELALLVPASAVFDARLLRALSTASAPTALVDSAPPEEWLSLLERAPRTRRGYACGAMAVNRAWLAREPGPAAERRTREVDNGRLEVLDVASLPQDSSELRRALRPFWFPAPVPALRAAAKQRLLDAAQKGALDVPAYLHAPIENRMVGRLCETGVTPNHLTVLTNVVAWGVTALLASGHFGWGAAVALAVGILDGLDGKQARVKLETSKGGVLEHWFDFLFEASWWIALAASLQRSGLLPTAFIWLLVLYVSEGIDGLAKWSVRRAYGRSIDEMGAPHRVVRLLGGRRNVYVWIFAIGVLLGRPATAYVVLACWEAVTAALHLPLAASALHSGPPPGVDPALFARGR